MPDNLETLPSGRSFQPKLGEFGNVSFYIYIYSIQSKSTLPEYKYMTQLHTRRWSIRWMDEMLHFLDYVLVVKSVDVGLDDAFLW